LLKFDYIFISSYELRFLFFFNFYIPKTYVFKSFTWVIIHLDFVGFIFRTSKLKLTSATLNTSFQTDLGRFASD